MNFELNSRNLALLAVLVVLLIVAGLLYNIRQGANDDTEIPRRVLVSNYSRFFTVSNSANSYINFLARGNAESLMILLDDGYIARHNLNVNNVLDHLDDLAGEFYSFNARRMYQYPLSRYMIRYYIHGHLRQEILDGWVEPLDYYLILTLDNRNFTFSITPYDGASFRGAR